MKGGQGKSKADALREAGIFTKDFFRADEIRRKLLEATSREVRSASKKFASKDGASGHSQGLRRWTR